MLSHLIEVGVEVSVPNSSILNFNSPPDDIGVESNLPTTFIISLLPVKTV